MYTIFHSMVVEFGLNLVNVVKERPLEEVRYLRDDFKLGDML